MAARALLFTDTTRLTDSGEDNEVSAVVIDGSGITEAKVYDGVPGSGGVLVVLATTSNPVASLNSPVRCAQGIHVVVTGTGEGSVHV